MTAPVLRLVRTRAQPVGALVAPWERLPTSKVTETAADVWGHLSQRAREALRLAYRRGIDAAVQAGVPDGGVVDYPPIPADTHHASVRSLERRGLTADGRLTPLGVEVTRIAGSTPAGRPVVTARLPRPRL